MIATVSLMRDDFTGRTRPSHIVSNVIAGVGAVTLLLACLGIFGVVSYRLAHAAKRSASNLALVNRFT